MSSGALALVLAGLALGSGCAARRGPVEPPPAWQAPEARDAARLEMADALIDSGSAEAALQLVSRLRDEGLSGSELNLIQARALRELGLTDDAEALLLEEIKRRPRQAAAHDQLGVLYLDQHRVEEALTHLQRAAQLAPDDALVQNNLGFALMTAGRSDDAIAVLREALRLDGSNRQVRNNLGFALVGAGRDDEALRVFRAGLPEADARYNLGLGLEMRGDAQAAVDQYAQVVASWPTHQPSVEGLKRLRPDDLHRIPVPMPAPSSEEP